MTTTAPASPLARMAEAFGTDWWNDSCDPAELASAIARGATGATSNPTIVLEVMKRNRDRWWPHVRQLAAEHPAWTEVELAWATAEEVAAAGAAILEPVFAHTADSRGARRSRPTQPTIAAPT